MRHLTNENAAQTGRKAGATGRPMTVVVLPCVTFVIDPIGEVTP